MKKVLFATTALVASAGIAAADGHITFSGSAAAGIASDEGAAWESYGEVELDITFSGETDNGLTFGATMDLNVGRGFDLGDNEFDVNTGIASLGSIYISGDFGTVTFDPDGTDDLYDDDNTHDIAYAYSGNGLSLGLTLDVDPAGAPASTFSAMVGYTMDAFSFTLTGNDGSDANGGIKVNFGYDVSSDFNVYLEHNMPAVGADVTEVGLSYTMNGVTLTASADTADDWDLGVTYTMDAVTISASTDESSDWELTGSYDLGGGAAVVAGVNSDDSAHIGLTMSF